MNKKCVLLLLLPSVFFVTMACLSLFYATALSPNPNSQQETQKNIDELAQKAGRGEIPPDKLVELLKDSWSGRSVLHETLAKFHATTSRIMGFGILLGVVIQIYAILRVAHKLKTNLSEPVKAAAV